MDTASPEQEYGPWNPGLRSPVPSDIRPLSTLLSFENVSTPLDKANELAAFSGLDVNQIVKIRPERLTVHETLIRVTANISVPDGSKYEDLGKNFREIVKTIIDKYIDPKMNEIKKAYDDLDQRITAQIQEELSARLFPPHESANAPESRGFISRLLTSSKRAASASLPEDPVELENQVIKQWQQKAIEADDAETEALYNALVSIANSIRGVQGRISGGIDLIAPLVSSQFCNTYSSILIGDLIEPMIIEAAQKEGFSLLPVQEKPIIMNTKGASASGKSTLRPLQKKLAGELGVEWAEFALISPDIWRKYLLDYDSLGDAYKYAGSLTGDENAIIDQKLDDYMAKKASAGRMSHLLIDRFRFDSFTPVSDELAGNTLLTRFGNEIYMFFMITPPEETVVRSWKRGEEVGRYKTVDDLLYHNVEAFTGMPLLFFTWALKTDKSVHYEFLDNDVPLGDRPKTVAFGRNGALTILDIKKTLDIERFKKININGQTPAEVYPDPEKMQADQNTGFLQECAKLLPSITFAEQSTGRVYGNLEKGEFNWTDGEALANVLQDEDTRTALEILTGSLPECEDQEKKVLSADDEPTLGQWGEKKGRL